MIKPPRLWRCSLWIVAHLPFPLAMVLSRIFIWLWRRMTREMDIAYQNTHIAGIQLQRLEGQFFRNVGRILILLTRFQRFSKVHLARWVRVEGASHWHAAKSFGAGIVLTTAHLGNWELAALACGMLFEPLHAVAWREEQSGFHDYLARCRQAAGNRMMTDRGSARELLRLLNHRLPLLLLCDAENPWLRTMQLSFFGEQVAVPVAAARIAVLAQAPLLPVWALWSAEENRYVLRIEPPMIDRDASALAQRVFTLLEQRIREHPDQYMWFRNMGWISSDA